MSVYLKYALLFQLDHMHFYELYSGNLVPDDQSTLSMLLDLSEQVLFSPAKSNNLFPSLNILYHHSVFLTSLKDLSILYQLLVMP